MTELVAALFSSDSARASKVKVAALLALVVGSVLLHVPFLHVPMLTDEGFYAFAAHFTSPQYQLYRDLPIYRPQGIIVVYKLILAFGDSVATMRMFAAVYNALTVVALFWLARALGSERVAWVAAALYALFGASPHIEGFTANSEIFAQLPIVIAALLTWQRRWAWAGVAAGIAFVLKPSGIGSMVLTVLWCFATGVPLRGPVLAGAGFAAALIPSIVHGISVGWEQFWYCIYARRIEFLTGEGGTTSGVQLARLESSLLFTLGAWCVPAVLAFAGLFRRFDQPRSFGAFWLLGSLIGMSMGGFWFWHYFMQMMPPLCLLAALGLESLLASRFRSAWAVAVLLSASVFVVREGPLWIATPKEISWQIYHRAGYLVADRVGAHIAATTKESDTIFVAFAQAEVYYLARRKPSLPYMFYVDFEYSQRLFDAALTTIRERKPALLVIAQPPPPKRMRWGDFLRLVSVGYEPDAGFSVDGGREPAIMVFRRKTEPKTTELSNHVH